MFLLIDIVNILSQTVSIDKIPTNIDDFVNLTDKITQEPEGGERIFLLALKIYSENKELGKQCLVVAVDMDSIRKGDLYKGYSLLNQDMSRNILG